MADGITDEMRIVAGKAVDTVYEEWRSRPNRDAYTEQAMQTAGQRAVEAVLAGRTIIDLPEPDGEARHCPTWQGPEGYGVITATVWSGKIFNNEPMVDTPDHMHKADEAEQLGWMLIASAVRARKMAAEKSAGAAEGVL